MPPYSLDRRAVHRLHRRLVADVDLHRQPADLAGDARRRIAVDVGDDDARALVREELRRLGAHAAAGAGDHAHLSVETVHSVE